MVWHFFKKDVRLLWPLALAVVLLQALCAVRTATLGDFDEPPGLDRLTAFLPLIVYLGIGVIAVTVVQQEPLSGTQEDWLIRPIRRRDLVLSKVVFVLLLVNLPIAIVDVLQQLAFHFPLSVSIEAAVSRSFVMVSALSVPALLLGAVTRSLTEAFVFGIAAAIGFAFLFAFMTSAMSPTLFQVGGQYAMRWISVDTAALMLMLGATAILTFQYITRRSMLARTLTLTTVLIALCIVVCLPGTFVIALQEMLWRSSASRNDVKLTFDATRRVSAAIPRTPLSYGNGAIVPSAVIAARAAEQARIHRQIQRVGLPLRITGMRFGDILIADRIAVRILTASGQVLYQGARVCTRGGTGVGFTCSDNVLEVWANEFDSSNTPSEQRLNLPTSVYERIKHETVRLELTYLLTRLAPQSTHAMSATGERSSLPEMGSCATRIDNDVDEVQLGCLTNLGVPSCATAVLEDPETNRRNPALHFCDLNYGPLRRVGFEDAVSRSRLSIPFEDRSGLAHYPVDRAAIDRARILITVYDPVEHFHSTLHISGIRLEEWHLRD